jgi:uncharacterized protein YqjF (DUF2071 family)
MTTALLECPAASSTDSAFAWPIGRPFLTAEWRHLAMLNFEIDPRVLAPYVPAGTELDLHDGVAYASIVGFLFQRTRLAGLRIPFHERFEEVNLRFYVRRETDAERRRGVTFIRELVPRRAVTFVANAFYGENYRTVPMNHRVVPGDDHAPPRELHYQWRFAGRTHRIALHTVGAAAPLAPGSHEEFIAEHYWGYTALRRGAAEYQVAHPPWRICPAVAVDWNVDVVALYGPQFASFLRGEPASAFWAEGSPVRVYQGRRIIV